MNTSQSPVENNRLYTISITDLVAEFLFWTLSILFGLLHGFSSVVMKMMQIYGHLRAFAELPCGEALAIKSFFFF